MELERVFSSPATLKRLRSAPLGPYLDDFCSWLLSQGFSRHATRLHLCHASYLNEHLNRQGMPADRRLRFTDIDDFFAVFPAWCRRGRPLKPRLFRVRYSINRFSSCARRDGSIPPPQPRFTKPFWVTTLHGGWLIINSPPPALWSFEPSISPLS